MTGEVRLEVDAGGYDFPVTGPAPRLSWTLPEGIGRILRTDIHAEVDGTPHRISARGSEHRFVPWPWSPLPSRAQVRWRVHFEGAGGELTSEWAAFETGLFDEEWQAHWITPPEDEDPGYGIRPAQSLSVAFTVSVPVRRARLYSTALGIYEAFLNGEVAGTGPLAPGSTSYDRTLYAQASDVTDALRRGDNQLEIVLSDGWYRGQVGAFRRPSQWGTTLAARAELHIQGSDGSWQIVRSDDTWRSAPSTITRADLMEGQHTDFTTPITDARPVLVDQVDAPPVSYSPAPPIRVVDSLPPVRSWKVAADTWVLDFGQNASGRLRLEDLGPAGTLTAIDHGEHLDEEGDLSTSHLDSTERDGDSVVFTQHDEVISDGTARSFEPAHTLHGFQYARIRREGADLDPATVTMQVVHTDLRRTGTFSSSSTDLNRLHDIADWSFRGNAVDVPTDCPTRERLAWTGDYQVFAPTATRLYDVLGFSRKWLASVRDDQLDDGRIPNFAPDGRRIKHHLDDQFAMMTGSAGWGDAIVAVPWELYRTYGDTAVLAENWDSMRRWVEWQLETARTARHHSRVQSRPEPEPHESHLWDGSFHWGEWCEPVPKGPDGHRQDPIAVNPTAWFMADKGEVGTAYLHRSASTLARIARILDRLKDAELFSAEAGAALEAWRTEYLHPDGRTATDSQASYVRALDFGLIPEELRPAAADRLAQLIRENGNRLSTGFLSTGALLPVLADSGHADLAYRVLLQRTPPSWMYMLDQGATTVWEDWEGIDEKGIAHESLNHYSKGSVVRFLHTHVLGLRQDPDSIAWESFTLAPTLNEALTWVEGTHDSPQGTIKASWRLEDDELSAELFVPAGSRGTLRLPGATPRTVEGPATLRVAAHCTDVREPVG